MTTPQMPQYQFKGEQKILLSHFGTIDTKVTNQLLRNLKEHSSAFESEEISKKKVYKVSVECLENACRHSEGNQEQQTSSLFLLGKDEGNYHIVCGNYIEEKGIEIIKKIINEINALKKDEIKEKYKSILLQNNVTFNAEAQLGILDMAIKSGNKLEYEFHPAANNVSFFIIKIQIPRISTIC